MHAVFSSGCFPQCNPATDAKVQVEAPVSLYQYGPWQELFAEDFKKITLIYVCIDTCMPQHSTCMEVSLEVRIHFVGVSSVV